VKLVDQKTLGAALLPTLPLFQPIFGEMAQKMSTIIAQSKRSESLPLTDHEYGQIDLLNRGCTTMRTFPPETYPHYTI
jgi:hypothetical protein